MKVIAMIPPVHLPVEYSRYDARNCTHNAVYIFAQPTYSCMGTLAVGDDVMHL